MPRLAIATSREHARGHADDLPFLAALAEHGIVPELCVWNDPGVDWSTFDVVLIRTIWDYYRHYASWLGWLDALDAARVRVLNPTAVLRWNADKRYLVALGDDGVPTIPSRVARADALGDARVACGWSDVVVKPTVSAGAWHTVRGTIGDPVFAQAIAALPREMSFLVQPFVPAVAAAGEWSLLFFGDAYSHAVLKRPRAGDFRVQEKHGGSHLAAEPTDAIKAAARAALAAVARVHPEPLAYARVDAVFDAGVTRIMELELIEPQLFLLDDPAAGGRFAAHVARTFGA